MNSVEQALRSDEWNPTREAVQLHTRLRRVIDDDNHQAVGYLRDELRLDPQEETDRELILDRLGLGWGGETGRWHHRITWPYLVPDGGIAGSCGRTLIDKADHDGEYPWQKWMTTRAKWGFSKRDNLWGLGPECAAHIAEHRTVILVEGAKDGTAIMSRVPQAIPSVAVVAAALTPEQGQLLADHGAIDVYVLADNDAGGHGMVANVRRLAHRWPDMYFWDHSPALPTGKDPGDCTAEQITTALAWDGAERLWQQPPKTRRPATPEAQERRLEILRHPANDLLHRMARRGIDTTRLRTDCPFHDRGDDGSTDTLAVFEDSDDGGFWRWKCHSGRCNRGGTIIDFEVADLNIDPGEAFLRAADRTERTVP